jgi:hypothetical protein
VSQGPPDDGAGRRREDSMPYRELRRPVEIIDPLMEIA